MNATKLFLPPDTTEEAHLFVLEKDGKVTAYPLKNTMRLGRKTSALTVEIPLTSVIASRNHGEFVLLEDGYCYHDLGSLNGTFVNSVLYGRNVGNC